MVEDKVGKKPYLGIVIDYDKEKKLDKFSLDTLIKHTKDITHKVSIKQQT